ncbi:MAG: substrate-binding domain-containing protein [Aquificales bacterium]|nr:substrate-binding domain-containing protein [Aquificales bacterium]
MKDRITLKDVANQAGVSYQTVSKVLKGQGNVSADTKARIQAVVEELGYRPNIRARNLRVQRSHLIGYSWQPEPPDLYNPILEKFLQSIIEVAERQDHHILTFAWQQKPDQLEKYRRLIQSGRVDGLILSSIDFDDPRITCLMELDFPFVAFGRANPDWDFAYIDVDGETGLRQVTEHLLALGHRRIAVLAWLESSRTGEDRLQGYYQAMQQAGISLEEGWIERGENIVSAGYDGAKRLLQRPPAERPTALIGMSDTLAIGAINAVHHLGLTVGRDVSISGFDDTPLSQYLQPPLTTVRQPIWEIGQRSIELLFQIMESPTPTIRQILLPPKLIIRQSTGEAINQ